MRTVLSGTQGGERSFCSNSCRATYCKEQAAKNSDSITTLAGNRRGPHPYRSQPASTYEGELLTYRRARLDIPQPSQESNPPVTSLRKAQSPFR